MQCILVSRRCMHGNIVFTTLAYLFVLEQSSSIIMKFTGPWCCYLYSSANIIWKLATNVEYQTLLALFCLGRSAVCVIVVETCNAIAKHLLPWFSYRREA